MSTYKTLQEKMYEGINASIASATPVKDQYGNTVRTASKEAIDTADQFRDQQVAERQNFLANNPQIQSAEYAANLLKDVVVPEGGIERNDPKYDGISSADRDLLDDKSWWAIYGTGGYKEQDAALRAELNDPNITPERKAEIATLLNQLHVNTESLRYNTGGPGYSGYLGGSDGSMYLGRGLFESTEETGGAGRTDRSDYSSSGSSSSGSSGSYGVNSYEQYINDMYKAKQDAALAALDAAYKQNVNAIDRAGVGLDEAYQNARNLTAGNSEVAKRNFAQYAAANGLNSGTGGQAELARNVALQNNLNAINSQEAQSIADLELQRANAEVEYNNAIAQAEAEGDYELAAALYQEKVRYDNAVTAAIQQEFENNLTMMQYQNSVDQQAWQNAFAVQQYKDSLEQQEWENLFKQTQYNDGLTQSGQSALADYGAAFLNAGVMPSAEMLAAMDMSEADAQRFIAALQSATAADTPVVAEPTLTYSQVMSAIENNMVTPAVKDAFEYYNGISYDEFNGTPEEPPAAPVVTGDPAVLWDALKGTIGSTVLGQHLDEQRSNMVTVDVTLSQMRNNGASPAECLGAIQNALDTGVIAPYAYDYLVKKHVTGNG